MKIMPNRLDRGFYQYQEEFEKKAVEVLRSGWYVLGKEVSSFEEELKGGGSVKSTFLANIDKLFASALTVPEIAGVIINPWNRTIQLDKNLIQIIEGAKR